MYVLQLSYNTINFDLYMYYSAWVIYMYTCTSTIEAMDMLLAQSF